MAKRRQKELTLGKKLDLCNDYKKTKSMRITSRNFGVSLGTVSSTVREEDSLRRRLEEGANMDDKRNPNLKFVEVDRCCWEWLCEMRATHTPISGSSLKQKAMQVSEIHGLHSFRASNGWLQSFSRRHNLCNKTLCGEAVDIAAGTIDSWTSKIPDITKGYEDADIYNADETVMFFRQLPTKSLCHLNEQASGGKMPKERLSILLCCSLAGEKLKPLVIGRAEKPSCFVGLTKALPVQWKHNKKAWMTTRIFEQWLRCFNDKMRRQKRKVLLFLKNCEAHPNVVLSHVKLVFFPPNTAGKLQPLNRGVINAFKCHYRKQLLRSLIVRAEQIKSSTELVKSVNVLNAVTWISSAWECVSQAVVSNCFHHAGFHDAASERTAVSEETVGHDSVDDEIPLAELITKLHCAIPEVPLVPPDEFTTFDNELPAVQTTEFDELVTELKASSSASVSNSSELIEVSEDDDDDDNDHDAVVTQAEAFDCIRKLRRFCAAKAPSAFMLLSNTETAIELELLQRSVTPKTLDSFDLNASHTILLVQPNARRPETRTYSDFESINEALEGVCRIYEEHLKRLNPNQSQITYDIAQLFAFIDQLADLTCLVYQPSTCTYAPHNKDWIKEKIYVMLRTQVGR